MNIIEKLENYIKDLTLSKEYFGINIHDDLRAIIEEYKNTQEPVAYMFCGNLSGVDLLSFNKPDHTNSLPNTCVELFTHPPLSDETVKDAAIGKLVREKMQSGNDVPVSRCTITRAELDEAMKAES
jgi:hypothetical protein